MKCLACKHNRFRKGTTVLPIERGNAILLITDIPARVCENCGETYIDEELPGKAVNHTRYYLA